MFGFFLSLDLVNVVGKPGITRNRATEYLAHGKQKRINSSLQDMWLPDCASTNNSAIIQVLFLKLKQ